jgi:DNA-binding winged helix-turn-helix (wHTH) protein/predicted ATPase
VLDAQRCELRRDGRVVALQRRVLDLLVHLVEHRERVVAKEELISHVWRGTTVGDASISVAVSTLRRALGDCRRTPRWLATFYGRGYRFLGHVEVGPGAHIARPAPAFARGTHLHALVGRDDERQLLARLMRDVEHGGARVLILEGEPGIGKSRLLDWCHDEAGRRGMHVVSERCAKDPVAPPLAPWAAMERGLGSPADAETRPPSPLAPEAERVAEADRGASPTSGAVTQRWHHAEALRALIEARAARGAVVLLLDDLQWAHSTAVALLATLAGSLRQCRVLLIVATRSPAPDAAGTLADVARQPHCTTLRLRGLPHAAVQAVLSERLGERCSDALAARLGSAAGGNPFLLHQLAQVTSLHAAAELTAIPLADLLPASVRRAIADHFVALPRATHDMLRVAAAIGPAFSPSLLARVVERATGEVLRLLEPAYDAGLLGADPEQPAHWRFVHGIVGAVLRVEMDLEQRDRIHRRIAHAIVASTRTAQRGVRLESRASRGQPSAARR